MMWPFRKNKTAENWEQYLGAYPAATRKQRLLEECKRLDVSIHVDASAEASAGIYGELRGVASEAELERRLNTKKTILHAARANKLSTVAVLISVIALLVSVFAYFK